MSKKRRMLLIAGLVMGMAASGAAAVALSGCQHEVTIDSVTGVYYGEANGKECEIELDGSSNGTFSLTFNGTTKQGDFTYDGTNLNLTVGNVITPATLTKSGEEGQYVLKITYSGTSFELGLVNKYTVSFKDGSSVISSTGVVEGKTVKQPVAPSKNGCVFIGWYSDAAFTNEFDFASNTITGATDVFARFVQIDASKDVFEVSFDAGEGVTAPEAVNTINGVVYNLPTVSKNDATFAGWWVSDYNDVTKLTYKYEGQELKQNTTLFAVWDTGAPLVSVTSTGIKWSAKGTNNSYDVVVTLPDGTEDPLGSKSNTSVSYDFSAPGEYVVSVTLRNQTTKAYYNNKGLARVSVFEVEGNVLKFNAVENAEKYLITVICGDEGHVVSDYDLSTSTQYNFSTCTMATEGVKFIVKACADGYVTSVSDEYVLVRTLDAVTSVSVDSATDTVKWSTVENATYYIVEVTQDGKTEKVNVSAANAANGYSLDAYYGALTVKVYPVAAGYNSPVAAQTSYNKVRLAVPRNVANDGYEVSWSEVANAKGYIVKVGDTVVGEVDGTSYTLTDDNFVGGVADVYVSAKGANANENSHFSAALTINKRVFSAPPVYNNGNLSWGPVIDADYYEVKINDDEPIRVDGATAYSFALPKKGDNEISVRCAYKDGGNSDWMTVNVVAYSIKIDKNDGEDVIEVFKAANEDFDLEDLEKAGYTFIGWLNSETEALFDGVTYPASDLTLTASFRANKYTVTLKLEDGSVFDTVEVSYGEEFKFAVPESEDPTKTFGGWRVEANGQGTQYTDPEGKGSREWNIDSNTNLYVSWLDVFVFKLSQNGDEYSVSQGAGIRYLADVKIPAEYEGLPVTTVETGAFQNCTLLKSVQIPNTMQVVAMGTEGGNGTGSAFVGCTALEAVNVYEVEGFNPNAALFSSVDGVLIFNNEREHNVQILYYPYAKKGPFTIPDNVTKIPVKAFKSTSISEVEIPASVTSIDKEAFYMCYSLTKVTFLPAKEGETASSLTIGSGAFKSCSLLEEFKFPKQLLSFEMDLFDYCYNLKTIGIEEGGDFSSDDGVLIKTANNVKTVVYCPRNREENYVISSPEIKEIGAQAFMGCKAISEVVIPEWITNIGKEAFKGCTNVTKLTFNGVETSADLAIRESAFYGCTGLTELTLPENLTILEKNAFGNISGITHVTMNCARSKEEINYANSAFATAVTTGTGKTYVTELTLGEKVGEFEINGVFGSTALETIHVHPNNQNFSDKDGVLFNKDYTSIIYYPNGKEGDYIIPETVTEIGASVFAGKLNITNITIGANVQRIGEKAFAECINLETLNFIGGDVELNIDEGAFYKCTGLTELNLPTRLRIIGDEAFMGVDSVEHIVIPEGVTTLGHRSFGMVQTIPALKTFHISSTVTSIGELERDKKLYSSSGEYYYNSSKSYRYVNGNTDIFFTDYSTSSGFVFRGAYFEKITVAEGNPNYGSFDGVLCKKKDGVLTELLISPMANNNEKGILEIPSTITKIADMAMWSSKFNEIKFLDDVAHDVSMGSAVFVSARTTKVTFPQGITQIGEKAFYLSSYLDEVNIPNTVTAIGDMAFRSCSALTTVTFEKGGTEALTISASSSSTTVFGGCKNLTALDLPDRIVIGDYAFMDFTSLTEITIPAGVKSIGKNAFNGCTALKEITFAEGSELTEIKEYAFAKCAITEITIPESVTSIGNYAFQNCTKLQAVAIPQKVKSIGLQTFGSCTALAEVTFADNNELETLGNYAFAGDKMVSVYDLAKCAKLTSIGDYAFQNNTSLDEIVIPATVTKLGANVFNGCNNLQTVTFEVDGESGKSAISSIGASCFSNTALSEIAFPESTAKNGLVLGASIFSNCKNLTTVTLSDSVKSIDKVFLSCYSIKEIIISDTNPTFKGDKNAPLILNVEGTSVKLAYGAIPTQAGTYRLPEGITEISSGAFKNQKGIKNIILPSSLVVIGENAFENCWGLETVTFDKPNEANLETICANAFKNCASLSSIDFGNSILHIGYYAFNACHSLKTVTLREGFTSLGYEAFYESGIESITLPSTLVYSNVANPTTHADKNSNSKYNGDQAFRGCAKLKSVTINSTWLGQGMFTETGLEEITVPSCVTTLYGTSSTYPIFGKCPSLKKAYIDYSISTANDGAYMFSENPVLDDVKFGPNAKVAVQYMFNKCEALESIDLTGITDFGKGYTFNNCTALSSVTLDTGLSALADSMFYGCTALTSISLPDSISYMGIKTFMNSGLTSITIPASVTMFKNTAEKTTCAIGDAVQLFKGCADLTTVILNSGLMKMGTEIFADCPSLTTVKYKDAEGKIVGEDGAITLPAGLDLIGNSAFSNTGFTSVTLPDTVKTIGTGMFKGCLQLTSAKVSGMNSNMFEKCELLETVTLSDAITAISGSAFLDCTVLTTVKTYAADGKVTGDDGKVTLPSKLTGTGIAASAFKNTAITEVVVPANVTKIDNYAFQNCVALTKITLGTKTATLGTQTFDGCEELVTVEGGALTTIASKTFLNCAKLKNIDLSKVATGNTNMFQNCAELEEVDLSALKTIGTSAFDGCTKLATVKMDKTTSVGASAFKNTAITSANLPAVTTLNATAFSGCAQLTTVTLNDALKAIGATAFKDCTALSSITLPSALTTLNKEVFQNSGLTSISIPAGVTVINDSTFSGCSNLSSVTFAGDVTSLGSSAFLGCSSLVSITLPESLKTIGSNCFLNCGSLTSLEIPASVTSIAVNAFGGATEVSVKGANETYMSQDGAVLTQEGKLVSIPNMTVDEWVMPEGITGIAGYAFNGKKIGTLKLPASLTSIDSYAFTYFSGTVDFSAATQLTSLPNYAFSDYRGTTVALPEGITAIGNYAFNNCTSLTSVTIPEGVTTLGTSVFKNCTELTSITLPSTLETIVGGTSAYTFENCGFSEIVIPASVNKMNYCFKNCAQLTKVTLPVGLASASNPFNGCTEINEVIIPEGATYVPVLSNTNITSITIPASVTTIYAGAFTNCKELTTVVISEGVEAIAGSMFSGCEKLTSISLPSTITSIGDSAFENSGITSITLPAGLTSIGKKAFVGTTITQISLPQGLTTIGDSAFSAVPLTEITIPSTVTSIGGSAFKGCEQLKTVIHTTGEEPLVAGTYMFADCISLVTATIGGNFHTSASASGLNTYMFQNCTALETVVLGEGIEKINTSDFSGCTALKSINIPSTVIEISAGAFDNCTSLMKITIPASVDKLYAAFAGWTNEQEVTFEVYAYDGSTGTTFWYRKANFSYKVVCVNPVYVEASKPEAGSEG